MHTRDTFDTFEVYGHNQDNEFLPLSSEHWHKFGNLVMARDSADALDVARNFEFSYSRMRAEPWTPPSPD